MKTKIALVVDWLDKYGGAERVLTSLNNVFCFKSCYTIINVMEKEDLKRIFPHDNIPIKETCLKKSGKHFRYFFLTFPTLIKTLKVDKEVDVIISSSHASAKGIKKSNPNQLHISYFQARNLKYIWSDFKLYFKWASYFLYPFIKIMRLADVKSAQEPDYIISNSKFVQKWVYDTYKRKSDVIYPPVDLSLFTLHSQKKDFYVAVGRIEPYKRFDIIIDAFNKLPNKRLIVIGDGSQLKELKRKSTPNIEFTGFVESHRVYEYIKEAKGFIHAGIEDFGIAPIEAQACGTPVIAYGFGGVLETIIDSKTGIFFNQHNSKALLNAIKKFERVNFNYIDVRKNALRFSTERFEKEIKDFVEEKFTGTTDKI
ncbi:glycosyltransferase [Corallibacter sp.]|uniref:glycosyltransferase n=1 Tax=Corallibacter sp. TaxID=2038084 RepID=UPI003AB798D7